METKKPEDQRVDINFESHPPIEDDLNGIATLMRQTLLQFVDCYSIARYLIHHKDLTQVIAQEEPEEENTSEDDEPDNDIYGVCSIVELPIGKGEKTEDDFIECRKQLLKFIRDKCPKFKDFLESLKDGANAKIGLVINERYINLPPQLSLPTLKTLTKSIDEFRYTHLVFISKILLKSRDSDTKLQSKKSKSGQTSSSDAEPLIFINPEEEIISENADYFSDIDVSAQCDENASWLFGSDMKYIPHRRILVLDFKNWPKILKSLEKELE